MLGRTYAEFERDAKAGLVRLNWFGLIERGRTHDDEGVMMKTKSEIPVI
jgi:hypothetical protein